MLLLCSSSDKIQVVTDSSANVDVHASYIDNLAGTMTPGRLNTQIAAAQTTDVVASPSGSTIRNVKRLSVRNKHASLSVTVTIKHTDGSTAVELDKRLLGPGQSVWFTDDAGWFPIPSATISRPWFGNVAGCMGDGDPGRLLFEVQRANNVAATPTNISTSIARCSLFILPFDMTVNRIRFYGVGAVTTTYKVALYRYSDLARLSADLTFTTASDTWGNVDTGAISLTKDVPYFIAMAVNTTGTTAGVACMGGSPGSNTTGRINTAPGSLPNNLQISGGYVNSYQFQFAVSSGALPDPAASLAAQAAWTGGMGAFWLDNIDA